MIATRLVVLPLLAAVCLGACERSPQAGVPATPIPEPVAKTKTLETSRLEKAVDAYEREPSATHEADVEKALADLDGEIAELEGRVARSSGSDGAEAEAKHANLKQYRETQAARFTAFKAKSAAGLAPTEDGRSGSQKAEDAAGTAGEKIKEGAQKTGDAIEGAGRKAGEALKDLTK